MIILRFLEGIRNGFEAEGHRLRDRCSGSRSFSVVHSSSIEPIRIDAGELWQINHKMDASLKSKHLMLYGK